MSVQTIETPEIATPGGPFSPATVATGTRIISISGQIGNDAAGKLAGAGDAEAQARQCLRNLDVLLGAAGARREDVVKVTVYLTNMADRAAVARARAEYFGEHRPAATLVEVSALVSPELLVEIEATAVC